MRAYRMIALMLMFLLPGVMALAQESEAGHSHEKAEAHGGSVVMTQQHHFEVVPMMHGLAVFAYDYHQNPIDVSNASGTVTIVTKSGKKYSAPLEPYSQARNMMGRGGSGMNGGSMPGSMQHMNSMLYANVDLANINARKVKADVSISGLSSSKESQASFRETVTLSNLPQNLSQMMQRAENHNHGQSGE